MSKIPISCRLHRRYHKALTAAASSWSPDIWWPMFSPWAGPSPDLPWAWLVAGLFSSSARDYSQVWRPGVSQLWNKSLRLNKDFLLTNIFTWKRTDQIAGCCQCCCCRWSLRRCMSRAPGRRRCRRSRWDSWSRSGPAGTSCLLSGSPPGHSHTRSTCRSRTVVSHQVEREGWNATMGGSMSDTDVGLAFQARLECVQTF